MKQLLDISEQTYSFIGKDMIIKGDLIIKNVTYIAGKIEGNLQVRNEICFLERSSHILGKITCADIDIHGHVEGEIQASGKVTMYSTATVIGKVKSTNLVIFPGASVTIEGSTDKVHENR